MRGRLNTLLKKIIACIVLTLVIFGTTFTASAASETYIKVDVPGNLQEQRLSKEMYYPVAEINAATFGFKENFKGITDIFSSDISGILLLCGDNSSLYRINKTYDKVEKINVVDKKNEPINFLGAQGIYADKKGNIYISDTENSRILMLDKNGKLITTIDAPVSDLIPKDFFFQPTSIARDEHDYIYVLSLGCYYGALVYTPEYEFMGFYGPNTVESNALDFLSYLWDRITSTEAKENFSTKSLPYSFSDFSFDTDGYMVTSTASVKNDKFATEVEYGQIKKITHNGSNILYKRNLYGSTFDSSAVNFLETEIVYGAAPQSINSIVTDENGYIFALEVGHGKIYIYDSECNPISVFGGGIGEGDLVTGLDSPPFFVPQPQFDGLLAALDHGKGLRVQLHAVALPLTDQGDDGFYRAAAGEKVGGQGILQAETAFFQQGHIPGQGGRVAGNIDDATGIEAV